MHERVGRDGGDALDARTSERLSTRLRQARQRRGLTLRALADAAGCSESLLSKIENGKAYPSLPMLSRLVRALDMTVGAMLDERDGREPVIVRAAPRRTAPPDGPAVTTERVTLDADARGLHCAIVHVEAGGSGEGDHRHAGEGAGCLLDGQIELLIDGRPHRLSAGDAFAFRADQPHRYRNTGAARATVFWVVAPPAG